jgi:hypothetical protein
VVGFVTNLLYIRNGYKFKIMKTKKFVVVNLFIAFALSFASCGKYEEGPGLSLRTKTARLAGTWKADKVFINSELSSDSITELEPRIEFTKDDIFRINLDSTWIEGTWEFNEEKTTAIGTYAIPFVGEFKNRYNILRLTNDEFWAVIDDREVHYVAN